MRHKALKYLLDIQELVAGIESFKQLVGNDFFAFADQVVVKRAVERDLEIIGEAVRALNALDQSFPISSSRKIIGLRNILAHAYDGVDDAMLWSIVQRDIPLLAREVEALLRQF